MCVFILIALVLVGMVTYFYFFPECSFCGKSMKVRERTSYQKQFPNHSIILCTKCSEKRHGKKKHV